MTLKTDTQDPETPDTQDPNPNPDQQEEAPPPADTFSWKKQLPADFANSPTMKKYTDTKEGLSDAVKAHLELQKLMGHEKVPIPKDANDTAAMSLFKKAMRVPEKPEGYALPDIDMPEGLQGVAFDKKTFSESIHKHNLAPEQAKGLWSAYTEMVKKSYADAIKKNEENMATVITQMRAEWGDAYASKVELGQMVVNKFSESQEMNDFITAQLVKDPRGIKFLAKLGEQFAENKIGDFKYQRHSLTPDELQREIDSIKTDMNHPYNNMKAPQAEHDRAVEYVNSLYQALAKARTQP